MFISEPHRLVFIHNPKCAGTTIWNGLRKCDSHDGRFVLRFEHPQAGWLQLAHPPLAMLRHYVPEIFEKVCRYDSYAIVREPHKRFASALVDYIRRSPRIAITEYALPLLQQEALDICARLGSSTDRSDMDLAHFQPQSDFVDLDGRRIVKNVYLLEDLPHFAADLEARHGIVLDIRARHNRGQMADNAAVRLAKSVMRPLYRSALSTTARAHFRSRFGLRIGKSAEPLYGLLFENGALRRFVEGYYKNDFMLYESLRAAGR